MNDNATPSLTPNTPSEASPWLFCVAPMLDWTDRPCRFFERLLTRRGRLYTEMVTTGAIRFGSRDALLGNSRVAGPTALQLGGSDPKELAFAVEAAAPYGYDEFNLNCGCPSPRVQKGSFGACLMLDAKLVAECVRAMRDATDKPVTVKHRIGFDERSDYGFVRDFVGEVYDAGCRTFIVHARAAWLQGLSPKENREVPPLMRSRAWELKRDFPDAVIVLNGAVKTTAECRALLDEVHDGVRIDGVMVGRAAYQTPWMLSEVDSVLYGESCRTLTREAVIAAVEAEVEQYYAADEHVTRAFARHLNGLCQGLSGARVWRRTLADPKIIKAEGPNLYRRAWREAFGTDF